MHSSLTSILAVLPCVALAMPNYNPNQQPQGGYKATISTYSNCKSSSKCGWSPQKGYTAASSQALYAASGSCGSCWRVEGTMDTSGLPIQTTPIVVTINDECTADKNPFCGQQSLTDINAYNANVDINLCVDSGASQAFFGSSSSTSAQGHATQVDCSQWQGQNATSGYGGNSTAYRY